MVTIIKNIPEDEEVSIYFHGKWHDLCRGPHLTSTGKIGKYFKGLDTQAGNPFDI